LSGDEVLSPPLDQNPRLTLAGLVGINAMTVPGLQYFFCYVFKCSFRLLDGCYSLI
jgi:hypothetical protein